MALVANVLRMTARKRSRAEHQSAHAAEVAALEAELAAELSTPPTRMASAGLRLACGNTRRLVLVLAFMLVASASLLIAREAQIARISRVETCADRFRQRLNFTEFVKEMKQDEFARYYRLPSKRAYHDVLKAITPPDAQVERRAARARKSSGGFIQYGLPLSALTRRGAIEWGLCELRLREIGIPRDTRHGIHVTCWRHGGGRRHAT